MEWRSQARFPRPEQYQMEGSPRPGPCWFVYICTLRKMARLIGWGLVQAWQADRFSSHSWAERLRRALTAEVSVIGPRIQASTLRLPTLRGERRAAHHGFQQVADLNPIIFFSKREEEGSVIS